MDVFDREVSPGLSRNTQIKENTYEDYTEGLVLIASESCTLVCCRL